MGPHVSYDSSWKHVNLSVDCEIMVMSMGSAAAQVWNVAKCLERPTAVGVRCLIGLDGDEIICLLLKQTS